MIAMDAVSNATGEGLRDWSVRQNSACGGDFAGIVGLPGGCAAFFIGDVTGHGLGACGKARTIEACVSRLLIAGFMPAAVLARADAELHFADGFGPFASLFLALIDPRRRVLWYSSAGHPTALLFSGSRHTHLEPTGPLLGLRMHERSAFGQRIISVSGNADLVAVTDGLTDARIPERQTEFFGSTRVVQAYTRARGGADDVANAIYEASQAFAGGKLHDDATVLVARIGLTFDPTCE